MSGDVTDWFARGTKPVHVGVYETLPSVSDHRTWFQHWGGIQWCGCGESPQNAVIYQLRRSAFQQPKWRGLVNKPRASK